jgi:hypothetical protein
MGTRRTFPLSFEVKASASEQLEVEVLYDTFRKKMGLFDSYVDGKMKFL